MTEISNTSSTLEQRPTLPGKVDGIVALDPCVIQCRSCGVTLEQDRRSLATFILLSRFRFHTCQPGSGRMCPTCLDAVIAACPSRRCKS